MIQQSFRIPFRLPSLNELIAANRKNPHAGAKLKRDTDMQIGWVIANEHIAPVVGPCIVLMVFHEPNRRRDVDNVESARKFVLDALVKSGVLAGDSPRYVVGAPSFTVYGDAAYVDVRIISDADVDKLRGRLRRACEEVER